MDILPSPPPLPLSLSPSSPLFPPTPDTLIAGVDEVGRGALFGPVVAAAVILPDHKLDELQQLGVQDSKKLTAKKRCHLAKIIRDVAIGCEIGKASVAEIERLNILQASLLAMKRGIEKLPVVPGLCLIDGNQKIPQLDIPQQTWVKGDSQSLVIAAASIVAKVWRDELITRLAVKYPEYDLIHNKGYATLKHRQALAQYGRTRQHRSFHCRELPEPTVQNDRNQLSLFEISELSEEML